MEWVVEKATELGVSKIVPIVSERSEKKGFNLMRAQKIAIEASEQSGRVEVPLIGDIEPLKDALESFQGEIVVFDLIGKPFSDAVSWLGGEKNNTPINIFVGPEGGWSPKEIEMFKVQKAQIFSLGQLTLRAETASIVALSKLGVL
jgi:16S rRNA (uracil1498-N3)-methyltransferase